MVAVARAQSERRKHPRFSLNGLVAEIRGECYVVLDISFGGMKIDGTFTVAGGLVDAVIRPRDAGGPADEDMVEVRGRVERVDGTLTAVRFSSITPTMARLIDKG